MNGANATAADARSPKLVNKIFFFRLWKPSLKLWFLKAHEVLLRCILR